jgi:hypothetical protein
VSGIGLGRSAISREAASISRATAAAPRKTQETVFVELGESVQKAQIARDGVQVAIVDINPLVLNEVIAGRPPVVTKVVSQSVAAGTSVPKGTAIDIVLAEPRRLPTRIIRDIHVGLEQRELGQVFDTFLRDDVTVRSVIARNERAETLSAADQAVLIGAFEQAQVPITTQPGHTVNEAFNTLQAAFTFGL